MFVVIAHYKGGVAKSTTAVHFATHLQTLGPTLLIDGDPNRSATTWAARGGFPFKIVDETQGAYEARNYQHVVIDTQARPGIADFEALAKGCDLLVIPTVPASLETDALLLTLDQAKKSGLPPTKYRILLTKVPPPPEQDGPLLRAILQREGIPHFVAEIPRLKAFEHAAAAGVPVRDVKHEQARRAWQSYEDAAKELIDV